MWCDAVLEVSELLSLVARMAASGTSDTKSSIGLEIDDESEIGAVIQHAQQVAEEHISHVAEMSRYDTIYYSS